MRIALNFAGVRSVGTQVYATGLLPALARLAPNDNFLLFFPPEVASAVGKALPPSFEQRVIKNNNVLLRLLWEQTILPVLLKLWRADVLFAPMEFTPLLPSCPTLLAVHSPGPFLGPEFVPDNFAKHLRRWLTARSCVVARRVVFVSHYSASFLGDKLHVPHEKRAVNYHGSDHARWSACENPQPILQKHGIEAGSYILYVSQLRRFKRPDTLIRAFTLWRQKQGRSHYKLVLTGTPDYEPEYGQELSKLVEELGVGEYTRFLGYVPTTEIPILYQNAATFVLPTSMETFGHPFVEAMASGVPMICADTVIAREICGDVPLYFPVGDWQVLSRVLEEVVSKPGDAREKMIQCGRERAGAFTFEREASQNLAILREIADRSAVFERLQQKA